jgi:mRNA interferase MazF
MKRGKVHLVDFGEPRGSEPSGIRPALVIQNDVGNRLSPNTIVAGISSNGLDRLFPVEVRVDPPEGGLDLLSKVDLSTLLTIDKARSQRLLGHLLTQTMRRVDRALIISLGVEVKSLA